MSPIDLFSKSLQFPVLYRDRLYYAESQEKQDKIMNQPIKQLCTRSVPLDVSYVPAVIVIGLAKTGKTTLSKLLCNSLGMVHLKPSALIKASLLNPFSHTA